MNDPMLHPTFDERNIRSGACRRRERPRCRARDDSHATAELSFMYEFLKREASKDSALNFLVLKTIISQFRQLPGGLKANPTMGKPAASASGWSTHAH